MARCGKLGCATRGRRFRRVLLALTFVLLASPLAAQNPQDAHAAAEQAIRRLDLQTELPREPQAPRLRIQLPPEVAWLMAAVGVGTVAKPPEMVLAAADDLARQGRFVDAMHVLLLQGLADIRRHLGEQFADSLTSREILRSTKLSDAGRTPLRDIITRVEWTYFGSHPAERADYAACRASFDALAHALHGKAAT
jgi:hypothetical protein